jgi:hypothetical protein
MHQAQIKLHSILRNVSTSPFFPFFPLFCFVLNWYIAKPGSVAEEDAPSGMMARGHYTAVSSFVDDDKHKHLEFEWSFDITKDW